MKTSDQDECVLCCREISIYAIGACDHPVCFECSTRMRVLCETNECPICRSNMPVVIYTYEKESFTNISRKYVLVDKRFQIVFENKEVQEAFQFLLENKCSICEEKFYVFTKLKEHVRRKHDLHYCELCAENLKIFPFERKVYNRKDLARHKRIGDPDETSHRGHPLCEFCDQRYVDSDELFRHLRREHYFCHFCDADGKHQYYEDYEYLRVHFRKEHYLCEEGDCANEQFIGAFRTEIDLKAHIAVHHSKNKSKAEARQARMLEFEFTYAHHNRASGSSSPRGGRYHQHKRQNVEENNSRKENKPNVQAETVEKIDMQSTLEFPFLSEDGETRSNHTSRVSNTNLNSVTLQSFGRNPVPPRQKKGTFTEDFPALVSTTLNVTSEVTNNQNRKLNVNYSKQNNPVRTSNLSIRLSQPKPAKTNPESREADNKQQVPTWISKKKSSNFEDEFPQLESKKAPVTYTNVVNTTVNTVQNSVPSVATVVTSSHTNSSGDQFVVIKSKSKKKKHHKSTADSRPFEDRDESDDKDEVLNKPNFLSMSNHFNSNDQENKDPFKKHMIRLTTKNNNIGEEETWQQKVSFGKDDFPPLAPSEVSRKPPGFNTPRKKAPPPGFSSNSNSQGNSTALNISLSTVARQLVVLDKNKINQTETKPTYSDRTYKRPNNYHPRNDTLIARIQEISRAQPSPNVFDAFKNESRKFRINEISAAEYYTKCLQILGEEGFCDIFPELIALLPDIAKQQELLDVHRKYQNSQSDRGAIPKQKTLNNNQVSECDICCQVLLESDYQSHVSDHQTDLD